MTKVFKLLGLAFPIIHCLAKRLLKQPDYWEYTRKAQFGAPEHSALLRV